MSNQFLFADEPTKQQELPQECWKILIVDDEPEVHAVTKLALSDFSFLGRGLEFHSAYSGEEARELATQHPDAAIVLLDVVMETDDAGLHVAKFIREDIGNRFTRIILRTGQPGQAPERTVIVNYDINDYKSKTELTAQKLFTAVMSSLRSYRDIISIDHSRHGLEKVIASSTNLFALQSMEHFVDGLVQQLSWVIGGARQTLYAAAGRSANPAHMIIRAAYGEDADQLMNQQIKASLPKHVLPEVDKVVRSHGIFYGEDFVLAYCPSQCRPQGALLCMIGLTRDLTDSEKDLLQLFADNVQLAHDNVTCLQDTDELMADMVSRLMVLEQEHVAKSLRQQTPFVQVTHALATQLQLSPARVQQTATAATMYERAEQLFAVMDQQPASKVSPCQERLKRAVRPLHMADSDAAQIAYRALNERLERFDGLGLPEGKQGQSIAIESQVLGMAMHFSKLAGHDLSDEGIVQRLQEERERHFSAALVDAVSANVSALRSLIK
ncbi:MAG: response regulator [Idiomarina sp.]|nr:response regulator [Idiomarina sp.]